MELVNPIVRRWLREGEEDPVGFWARQAAALAWLRRWDETFVPEPPSFRWFAGGLTNLCHAAVDHHVAQGRGGHAALVYANERGARRVLTYAQLLHEVCRAAAALRGMGIGKGDRITLHLPTCPEAIVLMLAAVRIGAIHHAVPAGSGEEALGDRLRASGSRAVFTADVTWRKGKETRLKELVDGALRGGGAAVEHVVVLPRGDEPPALEGGRDLWWRDFLALAGGHSGAMTPMEANEPAFLLATSGATARPRLAVHVHGGLGVHVHAMGRICFGLRPSDVWWSTPDLGSVAGHGYLVYAPLLAGCTTVAYEGALDHPGPEVLWRLVEELRVTGILTAPTAVRLLMRYGEAPARASDLRSLERVSCSGEPLDAPAWEWLQRTVLDDRVPVLDSSWQPETGGPVFGNPYGLAMLPIKPGSAALPLPGIDAAVVNPADGRTVAPGEEGVVVLRRPFPGLIPSLWGEPERYAADYWQRLPDVWWTGDSASVDEDGYFFFAGRADELVERAGHGLGTIEAGR